jgi:hypothetical protein
LVDFDGDGVNDLLSGSYPGELYFFKGLGGGRFAPAEQLKQADGKPVKLGLAAVVFAHDWDGDGDLDLVVGDIEGQVHLVINEGSKTKPSFGKDVLLQAGGNPIKLAGGDAGPSVADWDGDGKADLLVGSGGGGVYWYRNTGTNQAPKLAAAETLIPEQGEAPAAGGQPARSGMRAKVHAVDWNKDGKLDLLVGDFAYAQAQPALTDEQKAQQESRRKAWMKEYTTLQQAPPDETTEARRARMKKTAELITRFKELNTEVNAQPEYHGYVWLYLRQDGVARAE